MNPEVAQLLVARGADLTIRARVPGHYGRPGELLDMSAADLLLKAIDRAVNRQRRTY